MKKETGTCFVPIFSVGNISGRQAVKPYTKHKAGECSGCNASDVKQKAVPLVFYCRLKS